jgi:hypothetical protein
MASDRLPPVPVAARLPLLSLADPAWGEVVPPDMGAVLTAAEAAARQSRLLSSRDWDCRWEHPCYACGRTERPGCLTDVLVRRCPVCGRAVCYACWGVGDGERLCCSLPDKLEVP